MLDLLKNPFVKSLVTVIGGAALPAIDAAIQHPTGGLATAIQTSPFYGALYMAGALFVHNMISASQYAQKPQA